jgi:hypothetical protein
MQSIYRSLCLTLLALIATDAVAGISRDPNGVNVNSQGATTVFITFGGLSDQVPVEATWCGELMPAAPDIGMKCSPATLFGRLPIRFDQSRLAAGGSAFTDLMSIPPSVARRAYQAAARGEVSTFFYVRRFVSTVGGPDEYVFVTCRLTGGGARVPLALLDVQLAFAIDEPVISVERSGELPAVEARIAYNGTGRLKGRWEVVFPGDEAPSDRDLLTEASLPIDERPLQRRYTEVERFNVFLPPTGTITLPGPDPARLPSTVGGLYRILLRIEATADKEGDSSLAKAAAGEGIIHSGAVAGFPLPTLRYFVGSASDVAAMAAADLALLAPGDEAEVASGTALEFSWIPSRGGGAQGVRLYRLEVETADAEAVLAAVVQPGIGVYRAPAFRLGEHVGATLRWRVVALGVAGKELAATAWRRFTIE